ncbi:glycosyltransferase [Oceaniradius stylonematis]|uniref:glycosyltransferase family 2 protein n=1 Tax=Oceaniradius stylonematis TaxID=2184161 RepID=UPI0035D0F4B0
MSASAVVWCWCACYIRPHFRRHALDQVGRWDPFNVTEDADLGMRLWRGGYRTAMISRPTLEDAPHTLGAWLPQRTRWFKGWMQTWIVHTREPARLYRNMHLRAFVITQLLLTGTFVSALLHPLVLVNAVGLSIWLTVQSPDPAYMSLIAWIDWLMIAASYLAFGALCWLATAPEERSKIGWRIVLIPVYWMAQSVAAWRALVHLFSRPFEWEKTPHTAHQRQD